MKKTIQLFALALAALLLAAPAFGQASLTYTTLSATVSDTSGQTIPLTSASGISVGNAIYIDKEFMVVNSVNATTGAVRVRRGSSGTRATIHNSGQLVYAGDPSYFTSYDRSGYCVATSELVLPVINVSNGEIFDCKTSVWERATQVNVATVGLALRRYHGIVALNYAGSTTLGSLSVAGTRGLAEIGSTTTLTGGYVYGAEGKARLNGVMTGGWVFGSIGQLDISNATLTTGSHIGGLWADAGATGPTVTCTFCDLVVATNTTNTTFNSLFYGYSKASYLFDLSNNGSAFINAGTGSSGSISGYLAIKVNGTAAYIRLYATPGT